MARELAEQLCEKWFEKGMRASWCTEMVDDFATALADERRRVWEEAAKDCRDQSRVYSGGELMKRNVLLNMADFFDAKAHAGQEG